MKIAITGHSAGIGQALAKQYEHRGHEIVGLSTRYGDNIKNIYKVADKIEPCNVFINNAQAGFAQTELAWEVYRRWENKENHAIINISSMITSQLQVTSDIQEYRIQKLALEETHRQMLSNGTWPRVCLVKPGTVKTATTLSGVDVDKWAETLVNILEQEGPTQVHEISLGQRFGDWWNES